MFTHSDYNSYQRVHCLAYKYTFMVLHDIKQPKEQYVWVIRTRNRSIRFIGLYNQLFSSIQSLTKMYRQSRSVSQILYYALLFQTMIVYNLDMNIYMIIQGVTLLFGDQEFLSVIQLSRVPFLLVHFSFLLHVLSNALNV